MRTASLITSLILIAASAWPSETPPDLPVPVASFGAASTSDGSVYIYGGHSGKRHQYNREDVHGSFFHWQPGLPAWEPLAAGEPAQGATLIATDKDLLRIGGMAAQNAKGEKQVLWSSATISRYDLADKKWHPLPNLPGRRSSHDSTILDNQLYVIGGWDLGGATPVSEAAKWHNDYLTLDLAHPQATWQSHPQPFERRALAACAFGGKIYAIGGMDSNDKVTAAVSVLDAASGQWSEGPPLPKDKLGGFGFAAVVHEGRLFASGAQGMLLELREGAWVPIAKLAHPRYFHRLVRGGTGKLIALGGESKGGQKPPPEIIPLPSKDSTPLPQVTQEETSPP